jgi:hypothetical protein
VVAALLVPAAMSGTASAAEGLGETPIVRIEPAPSVKETSAIVHATIIGVNLDQCSVEWGTTTSYGSSAGAEPCEAFGFEARVSATLTGLSPGTTYHFRFLVTNSPGITGGATAASPGNTGVSEDQTITAAVPRHWYKNGAKLRPGSSVPIVLWGGESELEYVTERPPATLNGEGEVKCSVVGGGGAENSAATGAGVGEIAALVFYDCSAPACEEIVKERFGVPGRGTVIAQNLPWSDELFEGGTGVDSERLRIGEPFEGFSGPAPGEVKLKNVCEVAATNERVAEGTSEGELVPEVGEAFATELNGSSVRLPSTLTFSGANDSALTTCCNVDTFVTPDTFSGSLKYLGYTAQEVIAVKR